MGAIGFDCACGLIPFERCLKACPAGSRCLTRPTLVELSKQRTWTGKPSVTQLIKGTREALLEILCQYYFNPKERAFQLLGTAHHAKLEGNDANDELCELELEDETMTGVADYLSIPEKLLADYKTLGSFKAAQILGMEFELYDDPSGAVYKSGANKGQLKQLKKWFKDESKADMGDYALQLNAYRRLIEKTLGFTVEWQQLQVTVRDGGTQTAEGRGIEEKMFLVDVPLLDNDVVDEYFTRKAKNLNVALEMKYCPKCSNEENWDGRKCDGYCDVAPFCAQMGGE